MLSSLDDQAHEHMNKGQAELEKLHYWAVGGLAVAAFAIFDRKHGLLAGIVIITLSLLLAASGIMAESVHGDGVARETLI